MTRVGTALAVPTRDLSPMTIDHTSPDTTATARGEGVSYMRFLRTKKGFATLAAVVVAAVAAVAAYAFFTETGSGSGVSSVVPSLQQWQVQAYTDDNGPMYPGVLPHSLTVGTATNPNPGAVALTQVTVTVSQVTHVSASCDTSQIQLAQPVTGSWTLSSPDNQTATFTYPTAQIVAAGASMTLPVDLQVEFLDNGQDQDACQGAQVTLETSVS
jgi:hypothetical protein